MEFTIGCTLSYSVETLTPFVFNLARPAGVCRDFAHLAIALCLGADPTRLPCGVRGLPLGAQRRAWYLFDPTRMAALNGLVRIGAGRDAADVAFCSIYGSAKAKVPSVWIKGPPPDAIRTTQAVNTQAA